MVLFNGLWIAREAPAALFYFSGALYGTAAGIVSSALPQPSAYVPRMLKPFLEIRGWDHDHADAKSAPALPALEPADSFEYSMLPIVVCGASGSGKTTLLSWWSTGRRPAACKPTVGSDLFLTELCLQRHVVSLQLWDTGDALQCRRLGAGFWRKAAALLCLLDLADGSGLAALDQLRGLYQEQVGDADGEPPPKPAAVLGVCWGSRRQVSREEAEAWCHARGATYAEMRSPDDIAALDATIESLVRECVCGGRETQL